MASGGADKVVHIWDASSGVQQSMVSSPTRNVAWCLGYPWGPPCALCEEHTHVTLFVCGTTLE
jgi:hypothetical protein